MFRRSKVPSQIQANDKVVVYADKTTYKQDEGEDGQNITLKTSDRMGRVELSTFTRLVLYL